MDGLRREGRLGSCLCFHPGEGGLEKLNQVLHAGFERQIYASVRDGYLRVALHGFHREEDIAPLVAWLG